MPKTEKDLMRFAAWSGGSALVLTLLVAWHGAPLPGDVRVIREFQGIRPLDENAGWVNALGRYHWQLAGVVAALVMAAFGPWLGLRAGGQRDRLAAVWTVLVALGLRILSGPLKDMAQAQRPSADFHVKVTQDFAGYGFPSGHVYGDVLMYGALAVIAPLLIGRGAGAAARVFFVAVIVLSGPMRMAVGAHWPSDVLGGYLWGLAALCLAVAGGRRLAGQR
jgi:undecaprenyl-diphosphatase